MARAEDLPNGRPLGALRNHLIATSVVATTSFAAIIGVGAFVPLAAQLGRADLGSERIVGLADHFLFLHSALWPLTVLSLLASITTATILYRRMRSPLVRFVKCFEAVAEGRLPAALRIRVHDYLRHEAGSLNRMIEGLESREAERAKWRERLMAAVDDLEAASHDAEEVAELRNIVKSEPGASSALDRADDAKG